MAGPETLRYVVVTTVFYKVLICFCEGSTCHSRGCRHLLLSSVADLLRRDSEQRSSFCENSSEVVACFEDCPREFFPDYIQTGFTSNIMSKLCHLDTQYGLNLHWDCIERHIHRLLTCVVFRGNMIAAEDAEMPSRLDCKKALGILDCPEEILYKCGSEAIEVVNEAFSLFFMPYLNASCYGLTVYYARELRVKYELDNVYKELAKCLDSSTDNDIDCFVNVSAHGRNSLFKCSERAKDCIRSSSVECPNFNPLNDFYVPIFSFGSRFCKKSSVINYSSSISSPTSAEVIPKIDNRVNNANSMPKDTIRDFTYTEVADDYSATTEMATDDSAALEVATHDLETTEASAYDSAITEASAHASATSKASAHGSAYEENDSSKELAINFNISRVHTFTNMKEFVSDTETSATSDSGTKASDSVYFVILSIFAFLTRLNVLYDFS